MYIIYAHIIYNDQSYIHICAHIYIYIYIYICLFNACTGVRKPLLGSMYVQTSA